MPASGRRDGGIDPGDAYGVAPISAPSSGRRTVNVVAPGTEVTFR
jgi:hypothetical protein